MSFDQRHAREWSQHQAGVTGTTAAPGKRTQVELLPAHGEDVAAASGAVEAAGIASGWSGRVGALGAANASHARHGKPAEQGKHAEHGKHAERGKHVEHDEETEGSEDEGAMMEDGELVSAASGSSDEGSDEGSSDEGSSDSEGSEENASEEETTGDDGAQTSADGAHAHHHGAHTQHDGAHDNGAHAHHRAAKTDHHGAHGSHHGASGGGAATGKSTSNTSSGNEGAVAKASGTDPPGPPKPGRVEIRSSTVHSAPGGNADTRTKVGVGEVVRIVGSREGHWTASHGKLHGANGMHTSWTAPATPGTTTIRLSSGGKTAKKKFKVIAPNHLSMKKKQTEGFQDGVQGVGMITNVTIGPSSVNFGNCEWLEVPGPATHIFGYFKKFKGLRHHPNPDWLPWNVHNSGLTDHASLYGWPKPWSPGGFQWNIPNKYRVSGVGGDGHVFTTTHQIFRMKNKKGTTTITKGGARVTRTP